MYLSNPGIEPLNAVLRLSLLDNVVSIGRDQPTDGVLHPTTSDDPTVTAFYSVSVNADQKVLGTIASANSDLGLLIYDAQGQELANSYRSSNFLQLTPASSSKLLLKVVHYSVVTPIDYSVALRTSAVVEQAIVPGELVEGTLAAPGDVHRLRFNAASGSRWLLDWNTQGDNALNLIDPNGYIKPIYYRGPLNLPQGGDYILEITSNETNSDYRLRLQDVATAVEMALGETKSLELARPNAWAMPDLVLYRIDLTAGQRLALNTAGTTVSQDYLGRWQLFDTNLVAVAGGSLASQLWTVPATGDYFLVVDAHEPIHFAGQMTVVAAPLERVLPIGQVVTSAIEIPGQLIRYNFTATAGQVLFYNSFDHDLDRMLSRLIAPDGTVIRFANTDVSGPWILPTSGDYVLEISAEGALTGDFSFAVTQLSQAEVIAPGQTLSGTLDENDSYAVFAIDGVADQYLLFDDLLSHTNNSGNWRLYGPDGWNVSAYQQPLNKDFAVTLPAAGRYYLFLELLSTEPVDYQFQLTQPPTITHALNLNELVTGQVEDRQRQVYTFSGTAGQVLYFDSLKPASTTTILRLQAPDGRLIATFRGNADGPAIQLPIGGQYRLSIVTSDLLAGEFEFRLVDITAQAPVAIGQPVTGMVPWLADRQLSSIATYRISVTQPQELTLDFRSFSNPNAGLAWIVQDPTTGAEIESGELNVNRELRLERAGEYVLVFTDAFEQDSEFRFQLSKVPNRAPQLSDDWTFALEHQKMRASLEVFDPDLGQILSYELLSGPAGAVIDAASGVVTWTPTESDGPGNTSFTIRVTDDGSPALSSTATLMVFVDEVNSPPELAPISDKTVLATQSISFTLTATDADLPANILRYSATSLPVGATIDPTTGVFSWTPTAEQAGATYRVILMVSDGEDTEWQSLNIQVQANTNPWHNVLKPLDVNGDTFITPFDALLIINQLNTLGSRPLTGTPGPNDFPYDTSDDRFVSPIDALLVINQLNQQVAGGGFKHGQHLAFDTQQNYPLPNLFVSILQRMGIERDKFASSTGSMRGLEAG